MLIKLTYYGKSKPTLVNLNNVETIYQVADKYQQKLSTKIVFKGGNYVNVEEDLQTILGLQNDVLSGDYQSTKWDSPSVDELLENEYNKRTNDRPRYNKQDYRNDHFANRY
jgi:hypothetical protein